MFVKSITWCSVTVVAILAAALLTTAPVSAHSDDAHQNAQTQNQAGDDHDNDRDDKKFKLKDPVLNLETGACIFQGEHEGTIGVDVTNPNDHQLTYKVTLNGKEKSVTVDAGKTEYIAFTHLSIGTFTVDVAGPWGTRASGSATITECHEHELPTVHVDACGCVADGDHNGHLNMTINNTNDYAVTYTIRINGHSKDVFVDAHSTNTVIFTHLKAGDYEISISGDDCTHLCLHATVDQCPDQTQPGQGSGNPTPAAPVTPAPAAPVTPAQGATLPAQLPNTSTADTSAPVVTSPAAVVAKVQAPKSVNAASLALIALGLPLLAAAAILRRQQLGTNAK